MRRTPFSATRTRCAPQACRHISGTAVTDSDSAAPCSGHSRCPSGRLSVRSRTMRENISALPRGPARQRDDARSSRACRPRCRPPLEDGATGACVAGPQEPLLCGTQPGSSRSRFVHGHVMCPNPGGSLIFPALQVRDERAFCHVSDSSQVDYRNTKRSGNRSNTDATIRKRCTGVKSLNTHFALHFCKKWGDRYTLSVLNSIKTRVYVWNQRLV